MTEIMADSDTYRPAEKPAGQPRIRIRPSQGWTALNLRDLWSYRELLYFLALRDIKLRYKQTLLGVAWAIIQPLFTMLIFSLFFGKLAGMPSDGIPYPLFAYAGLLPWTLLANAVAQSSNSLVASSYLVTKVYFPRMIVPAAAAAAGLVDFVIGFVLLLGLMAYYHSPVTPSILMLPGLVVLTLLLALAVGMTLSALMVKYRDIRFALPFVVQLWMFASPVIYPASLVPERWRWVLELNPLTGIIEAYRGALFKSNFGGRSLAISVVVSCVLLVLSALLFRRMERSFADII
jgi:lipopolysaccharide transport system permease protein